MEWLKDKKNLPIVAAIAVVMLLLAGGLIAFEQGLFPGGSSQVTTTPVAPLMPPGAASGPGMAPMGMPGQPAPGGQPLPGGMPRGIGMGPRVPGAPAAAPAVAKKPAAVNPAVGPDPFYIPGGQKRLAANDPQTADIKLPLRDAISPLNLFQIHPPEAPSAPSQTTGPIVTDGRNTLAPVVADYRLSGVITGSDGINAILEVGGQSQSVKPGDTLSDGSRIQNIQTNSLTLRTVSGSVITLPLSAGNPDQGANTPNGPTQFNGQPYVNGQPQFPPGNNGP